MPDRLNGLSRHLPNPYYVMAIERTLSIIKPDSVRRNLVGEICARFERSGLRIAGMKMVHLSKKRAAGFYKEHEDKTFFDELLSYLSSGPIVVQVLEGESAIAVNRDLMGATDPAKAAPGTIRGDFGNTISENAVHGSDSPESAVREIDYFFSEEALHGRF